MAKAVQLTIKDVNIDEIKPYPKNPRKNDAAVDAVSESIKQFGFKQPIVVDKDNEIVVGHTRWKAAKKLKLKTVPVHIAENLTDEQVRAYRLVDNKTNELAEWDMALLNGEIDSINLDLSLFGFEDEIDEDYDQSVYTQNCKGVQYEITGEEPEISDLLNEEKTRELVSEIEKSNVPNNIKEFLKKAAYRHNRFDYRNIAEYYAHANKEIQVLMEKSALVVIDVDNAIQNGYMNLQKTIYDAFDEENPE